MLPANRAENAGRAPFLASDDASGMRLAGGHPLGSGHRRVARIERAEAAVGSLILAPRLVVRASTARHAAATA